MAKALRDFSRTNPLLVIKGGLADGSLLSAADLAALADLPPREVLLARLAGALAAPMQQMAGLLQALPRNLAYGISALDRAARGRRGDAARATAEAAAAAERSRPSRGRPAAAEAGAGGRRGEAGRRPKRRPPAEADRAAEASRRADDEPSE